PDVVRRYHCTLCYVSYAQSTYPGCGHNSDQNSCVPMSGADGIESSIECHGALLEVKILALGEVLGSSSNAPAGIATNGQESFVWGIREPHLLQKARWFPGEES
ncbi:MAG: hypothetical protein RLN96_05115, partial [Pseudomonadales bacterium]